LSNGASLYEISKIVTQIAKNHLIIVSASKAGAVLCWGRGAITPKARPCPPKFQTLFDKLKASAYTTGAERSILWPSKYAKMHLGQGSAPDPAWGAHNAPLDPLVS